MAKEGEKMTQRERRAFLIEYLLRENEEYASIALPETEAEQKKLLRSLVNVRRANPVSDEFLALQDEYLSEANKSRGITDIDDLECVFDGVYLWRGDITTLKIGAIVNAANSGMTGCYLPCHSCIDNCIHTFAGVQLRKVCSDIMEKQGCEEPTGKAKITRAFNLPCDYVIHTVGPIVRGKVSARDRLLLYSCYKSCLDLAAENDVKSLAFCCISTGVFCFPREEAAKIAIETVKSWQGENKGVLKVLFNVFSEVDWEIYERLLTVK